MVSTIILLLLEVSPRNGASRRDSFPEPPSSAMQEYVLINYVVSCLQATRGGNPGGCVPPVSGGLRDVWCILFSIQHTYRVKIKILGGAPA